MLIAPYNRGLLDRGLRCRLIVRSYNLWTGSGCCVQPVHTAREREWEKRGCYLYTTSRVAWHGYHGDQTHRAAIPRLYPLFPIQTCVYRAEPSCCTFSKTNTTTESIYYLLSIANIHVLRMFSSQSKAY
jgi:hypothetical protein